MTRQQMELAGQYALGLLDGDALVRFEQQLADDPALAAAVNALQSRFHALDNTVTALPTNPTLWSAINQRLDGREADQVTAVMRWTDRRARPSANWMAMAASVVVALGVGYLAGSFGTGQRQPVMIAVLINEADATPGAIVEAFADDSVRLVPLERFDVPAGNILQVWTLPDVETGPVSLGTFSDPTAIRLSGPDLPTPQAGQLYEITLEQAPGSPTGRPTGPILVKGFARTPL